VPYNTALTFPPQILFYAAPSSIVGSVQDALVLMAALQGT